MGVCGSCAFRRLHPEQALRQGEKFGGPAVGLPGYAAIGQETDDGTVQGAAEGFHTVAGLEIRALAKALHDFHHHFPIKHAGNVVGDGGGGFATARRGQVSKNEVSDSAPNIGEGVAVKEEKRGAPVTVAKEIEGLLEGQDLGLPVSPLGFNRSIAL
jgi:hypothetical protein